MTRIVLIRHGEKSNKRVHLSKTGKLRSRHLPQYIQSIKPDFRPDLIIAMCQKNRNKSNRAYETVYPLYKYYDCELNVKYKRKHLHKMIKYLHELKSTNVYNTVLVCWEHQGLIDIVNSFSENLHIKYWSTQPNTYSKKMYNIVMTIHGEYLRIFQQFSIKHHRIDWTTATTSNVYKQKI